MTAAAIGVAGLLALSALSARAGDPFLRRTAAVEAVRRVGPAVVNITTEQQVAAQNPFQGFRGDPFFERFFQDFFERGLPQTVQSLGSGVLIDAQRHVLTNEHVIERATRIRVVLADEREFDATPIGADPNNDLAVLRVETDEPLPWVAPAVSGNLMVGEPVIAIGNPFGLSNTVTTGVISAIDRSIRTQDRVYHGFLQTDASINPGNSGGPLVNAEGGLIGINTAIYGGAQGIGFAIPIDAVKRVVRELIAHGEVSPVWLGLDVQDLDARIHEVMELPRGLSGALVSAVQRKSPAKRSGVQRGDLVVRFDGHAVRSPREFYELLDRAVDGQAIRLELWRNGESTRVRVVAEQVPERLIPELASRLLGLELEPNRRGGYAINAVRPESGSHRVGIRPGDLLLRINGRALADGNVLRRSVLDLRGQTHARLLVQRGRGRYPVTIPLG